MKNKFHIILILSFLSINVSASEEMEKKMDFLFGEHVIYKDFFFELKDLARTTQKEEISSLVSYPVNIYGGEDTFVIKNNKDFLKYYDAIFDQGMLETIEKESFEELFANWRGVKMGGGQITYSGICLDDDCKKVNVKIISFYNPRFFDSKIVKNAIEGALKKEKSKLHESLQTFAAPVFQWETETFIIRVDRLGSDNYRYAAWSIKSDQSKKPNIILKNGKQIFEGSGGNHYYEFKKGAYTYRCHVTVIGTAESPPGSIEVLKNDESILSQPVIKVLN
ncbi:MAG: hypothetical protein OEY96_11640 [Gammaproteobacteria bacterium]|nr:hypothetical protein [Gammaproteobacteria bacterium]